MNRVFIAFVVVAVFGGVLFIGSVIENKGCMPWQQSVHVGGGAFSEGDRGRTVCR